MALDFGIALPYALVKKQKVFIYVSYTVLFS